MRLGVEQVLRISSRALQEEETLPLINQRALSDDLPDVSHGEKLVLLVRNRLRT